MRHAVFGRQLGRTKNERRRLFQGLARELIVRGSIRTTIAKAKAIQPMVEKLVTSAKRGESGKKALAKVLADRTIEKMLISDAQTRFGSRTSGFTRIIRLGKRLGDSTEEALLQFVDIRVKTEIVKPGKQAVKPTYASTVAKAGADKKEILIKKNKRPTKK